MDSYYPTAGEPKKKFRTDNLVFRIIHRLSTADVDMEGRLRPGSLVEMMIQAAVESACSLGMGFEDLKKQDLFWVLHRLTIEINRPLKLDEIIEVETWPKDVDGLNYLRDFLVRDETSTIVARATSGWLAVTRQNKRLSFVSQIQTAILSTLKNKHALPTKPEKLQVVSGGVSSFIHPSWCDYDINRHVTSSRYIDWMIDAFPMDHLRKKYPIYLSINYIKEIKPGETIQLFRLEEGSDFKFEGINETTGDSAFRGHITF